MNIILSLPHKVVKINIYYSKTNHQKQWLQTIVAIYFCSRICNLSRAQQGKPISAPHSIRRGSPTEGRMVKLQDGLLTWLPCWCWLLAERGLGSSPCSLYFLTAYQLGSNREHPQRGSLAETVSPLWLSFGTPISSLCHTLLVWKQSQKPTQLYEKETQTLPLIEGVAKFWKSIQEKKNCCGHFENIQFATTCVPKSGFP